MKLKTIFISLAFLVMGLPPAHGIAEVGDAGVPLAVVDGGFVPSEVNGPATFRFRLDVTNRTATAIEFESFDLNRERVVQPGQTIAVYLSGLGPGRYEFFDDFHQDRRGVLVIN